jgi:hypothetical protein
VSKRAHISGRLDPIGAVTWTGYEGGEVGA